MGIGKIIWYSIFESRRKYRIKASYWLNTPKSNRAEPNFNYRALLWTFSEEIGLSTGRRFWCRPLSATVTPRGWCTMVSDGLYICINNGSMRGRYNIRWLLTEKLSKQAISKWPKSFKNTMFTNRILIRVR